GRCCAQRRAGVRRLRGHTGCAHDPKEILVSVASLSLSRNATVREALARLDATGRGILLLTDENGQFLRTVTDGDLRRLLLGGLPLEGELSALPQTSSVTISTGYTRRDAL